VLCADCVDSSSVGSVFSIWQNLGPTSRYSSFFKMYDTIEGARDVPVSDVYLNGINTTTTGLASSTTTTSMSSSRDNHTSPVVSASGIGLEKALANFAAWYENEILPGGK
jgi:hypothetical protein